MAMSVAFAVCHVSVVVCPCSITAGLAASVAVGVAGGGGEGGVAFAAFLLQPENDNTPTKIPVNIRVCNVAFVTLNPPHQIELSLKWQKDWLNGHNTENAPL